LFILPLANLELDPLFVGACRKNFPSNRLSVEQLVRISSAKLAPEEHSREQAQNQIAFSHKRRLPYQSPLGNGRKKDYSLNLESMIMVTGPSLVRVTAISAPNSPV